MTTEYWLQKKTIGGWSHVTSYQDADQAWQNYASCVGNGLSGYCWRLCKMEVIEVSMLNDVVECDKPIVIETIATGWGAFRPADILVQDAPKNPEQPTRRAWGDIRTSEQPDETVGLSDREPWSTAKEERAIKSLEGHGNFGKVWMVNHSTKTKVRVSASEVKLMEEAGYIRGGPRTQFE